MDILNKARQIYNIEHWSEGYFGINTAGEITVKQDSLDPVDSGIPLVKIIEAAKRAGLSLPLLLRFTDVLKQRVKKLTEAFELKCREYDYQGRYYPIYPIKVNQQRRVVEELIDTAGVTVGLEAGSKPELMAILGLSKKNSLLICNGYKDKSFIRVALRANQMGHRCFIVIEKLSEIHLILQEARETGIKPLLGVRVRLSAKGKGKWENTGGEKAKFGLTAAQMLELVAMLKAAGWLDCLKLLHCHLGSQIANIQDIQKAMPEVAHVYVELHRLGAALDIVDVGGGLSVDYEGTRSRNFFSMNYSMAEYAGNIVFVLKSVCAENGIKEPDIVTESGRSLTAHHAALITNIIDVEAVASVHPWPEIKAEDPALFYEFQKAYEEMQRLSPTEIYHDAEYVMNEVLSLFNRGQLSLEQRARAEQMYAYICLQIKQRLDPSTRGHRELIDELNERLAHKVFCNFSLFQSLPDVWAIDQIFPVLPINKLNEAPTWRGILQDITCDSDGKIEHYVDGFGIEATLPLPVFDPKDPYFLGIFLVGSYQEILGDLHNLFGDTNSLHVKILENGHFELTELLEGDTVQDALRYVRIDADFLKKVYLEKLANTNLDETTQKVIMQDLLPIFTQSTYLA